MMRLDDAPTGCPTPLRGDSRLIDVPEVANAQPLEMRYPLRVSEDASPARGQAAAPGLLRVGLVRAAVDRGLAIIRDTRAVLYDEASGGGAAAMEPTVVLPIVAEIVPAPLRRRAVRTIGRVGPRACVSRAPKRIAGNSISR